MNQQQCEEIFKRFAQRDFQPTTELQYRNAYELLVAVILSAQATDRSVTVSYTHLTLPTSDLV